MVLGCQGQGIAERMCHIFELLLDQKPIDKAKLAQRFNTSERTIYRDLRRIAPLLQRRGKLGLVRPDVLRHVTMATGLSGLFPDPTLQHLRAHIAQDPAAGSASPFVVHGPDFSLHAPQGCAVFDAAALAIQERRLVGFFYKEKAREVQPYRLINKGGVWYLVAVEAGLLKSFDLSRVGRVEIHRQGFEPEAAMLERVQGSEGIWFGGQEIVVEIRVSVQVTHYFKRQMLLPNQTLVSQDEAGNLLLRASVVHPDQILPIIRQWIPHLEIVSPPQLREALYAGLSQYLAGGGHAISSARAEQEVC